MPYRRSKTSWLFQDSDGFQGAKSEESNTILLDAGDTSMDFPCEHRTKGIVVTMMNEIGYST
jgi:hypothetical protein